ncbi:MAG: hypothetical protein IPN09_16165 [Bacteroidetes bacterium]|nr:hypothetical protein [Bacteroidota bacterium]
MKFLKIILLFFNLVLISCSEKFEILKEKNSNREELLKQIQTQEKIKYWQLEYFHIM